MRVIALGLGFAGLLCAVPDLASARDGCGRGLYWNGYACVQEYYAPPPQTYYPAPAPYYERRIYRQPYACPPNWEWNPRYGKCTSNYR
jgi:hypothetical protein